MRRSTRRIITSLAALCLTAQVVPIMEMSSAYAVQVRPTYMSLGVSLDAAQKEQTKAILGGTKVPAPNVYIIDGPTINAYLQDGSNASTGVYSSAILIPRDDKYGVRVEIVTPSKITKVSALTYQNAAISAGAKNSHLRIASVVEVTGEGALAGVYKMLGKQGVAVTPRTIKVAEKEIKMTQNIVENLNVTDVRVNVFIGSIKQQITQYMIQNNNINNGIINNIIDNSINQYNIQINNDQRKELQDLMDNYSKTPIAKDPDTIKQLDLSIMSKSWGAVLDTLEATPRETLLAEQRVDATQATSEVLRLVDNMYKALDADDAEKVRALYATTFVMEKRQPQLQSQDYQFLNVARSLAYRYLANSDSNLKARWSAALQQYDQFGQNAILRELANRIANATNLPLEAFAYQAPKQKDGWIGFTIEGAGDYYYHPQSGKCAKDENGTMVELDGVYDYTSLLGAQVEDHSQPEVMIPQDYQLQNDQANAIVNGDKLDEVTQTVETPVQYAISDVHVGDQAVSVQVAPNEVFKLALGETETGELTADESGYASFAVPEDTFKEGDELRLLVKANDQFEEKAKTIVIVAESSSESIATTEADDQPVTDASDITEESISEVPESSEGEEASNSQDVSESTTESVDIHYTIEYKVGVGETDKDADHVYVQVKPNEVFRMVFNGESYEDASYVGDAEGKWDTAASRDFMRQGETAVLQVKEGDQWVDKAQFVREATSSETGTEGATASTNESAPTETTESVSESAPSESAPSESSTVIDENSIQSKLAVAFGSTFNADENSDIPFWHYPAQSAVVEAAGSAVFPYDTYYLDMDTDDAYYYVSFPTPDSFVWYKVPKALASQDIATVETATQAILQSEVTPLPAVDQEVQAMISHVQVIEKSIISVPEQVNAPTASSETSTTNETTPSTTVASPAVPELTIYSAGQTEVYGYTSANALVKYNFAGVVASVQADANGEFVIHLPMAPNNDSTLVLQAELNGVASEVSDTYTPTPVEEVPAPQTGESSQPAMIEENHPQQPTRVEPTQANEPNAQSEQAPTNDATGTLPNGWSENGQSEIADVLYDTVVEFIRPESDAKYIVDFQRNVLLYQSGNSVMERKFEWIYGPNIKVPARRAAGGKKDINVDCAIVLEGNGFVFYLFKNANNGYSLLVPPTNGPDRTTTEFITR